MKKEYRNTVRTKKMIKQAFIELMGEKKTITVGELARRADIAKSTFYNHYEDIYAVVEEFENELILNLSQVLDEIETEHATEYDVYIKRVIEFLKTNEDIYRKAIRYSDERYDVRYFIEKLKAIISKKVFEEGSVLPFSPDKAERFAQIRFLTNACVDTMVDYFKGTLEVSLDQVGELVLSFLNRLQDSGAAQRSDGQAVGDVL